MNLVDSLDLNLKVIVCKHAIEQPKCMVSVYHGEENQFDCLCEEEHTKGDVTWIHAAHLTKLFPHISSLPEIPVGSMAYYHASSEDWEIATLI